ncbi:MAG: death-on-curing protein [Ignavibacteria bacterium RIFCSPLOWO2_12_FULL_56_21]|nr:MAG: death-on-curing protein [Ignavibacteria bacterium RIFCSPLOWO2_12_FULL_56_21]
MSTKFVPEEIVPILHRDLLQRYGGKPGIRDAGLLSSALSQPRMTYGGKFVHRTVFEKASAYGFHLCSNHPFIDGNKRVAFVVMVLFLSQNGYELTANEEEAFEIMMAVADGKVKKPALASWLKAHSTR